MSQPLFVFHGHFYQPPRENPWTGIVAGEPGAAPFHDWNARIDDECYRSNAYGRIVDDRQRITGIVNNYRHISFNVGPTLLSWLREHDPLTLRRMVEADRENVRLGHGNAIAQAYNHVILPLADARDRATQIRWGLAAFRFHFGRDAQAMWLPETAVSHQVLDDLIEHRMRFAILAPAQAGRIRPIEGGAWKPAQVPDLDASLPYLYRHRDGSGRSLVVFFYDGRLAHEISFGDALGQSARLVERVQEAAIRRGRGPLIHAAADGETAGHHNAWGDRVLAHALTRALPAAGVKVTHYAALLEALEPRLEVELDPGPDGQGTSWSCTHGVGRWSRDCGCSIGHQPGWNQGWRLALREAFDLLRDRARPWFETEAGRIFQDPWAARDAWVQVLLEPVAARRDQFLREQVRPQTTDAEARRGLALLEMQHQLMLQYTSCGWFFDDISGLESRQVLRYAAHALQIWERLGGTPPTAEFLARLSAARSNVAGIGDGAAILREILDRDAVDPRALLALALLRADHADSDRGSFGSWRWQTVGRARLESGAVLLHVARVAAESVPTGEVWQAMVVVRRAGDFELTAYLGAAGADPAALALRLREALLAGRDGPALEAEFGPSAFDIAGLVNEGGHALLQEVLTPALDRLRDEVVSLVDRHEPLLRDDLGTQEARLLREFAGHARARALRARLAEVLAGAEDPKRLVEPLEESRIDRATLRPVVERAVEAAILDHRPETAQRALDTGRLLGIPLYLHRAQEAWLEHAARFEDRDAARELGAALGFAPGLCASAAEGKALETARTGGESR